jgi:uncharacterized membrane protein (DUF485 family)
MSHSETYQRIQKNPKFMELVRRRQGFALALSSIVLLAYYGLMMTVAFKPAWLATPVREGATTTVGVPLIAGLFVLSWLLMGLYVRRANNDFDVLAETLIKESHK